MARKRTQTQVDIFNFSFLDIIACTVGALIFVLMMFMLHASQEAYKAASPRREQELLSGIAEMENAKSEMEILEEKLAAARNQLHEIGLAKEITTEKLKAENESVRNEIVRLAREKTQLEQKASRKKEASLGIWIEVIQSRESPDRKPYLVECRQNSVYLFEERLSETLERTRENISRWNALVRRVEASREDDFILFLIRPEGIGTFHRLRARLRASDIPHGYEPILADWKILGIAD